MEAKDKMFFLSINDSEKQAQFHLKSFASM
jgi:hypothetical protein